MGVFVLESQILLDFCKQLSVSLTDIKVFRKLK